MQKKTPVRMCVACRSGKEKRELLRIVKTTNGVTPDSTGKAPGRGAYLCTSEACFEKAKKTKALERAFKRPVSPDEYEKIKEVLAVE